MQCVSLSAFVCFYTYAYGADPIQTQTERLGDYNQHDILSCSSSARVGSIGSYQYFSDSFVTRDSGQRTYSSTKPSRITPQ